MENCSSIIFHPSDDNISSCHPSIGRDSKANITKGFYMYLEITQMSSVMTSQVT